MRGHVIEAELYGLPVPPPDRAEVLVPSPRGDLERPCLSPPYVADTTVVVAGTAGGTIDVEERFTFTADDVGSRILQVEGGWVVLAGSHLVSVGSGGDVAFDVTIS